MTAHRQISPGTVSKILWHFTGGPLWNSEAKSQNSKPRPPADADKNLRSILTSQELRLGSYREVIKVVIPKQRILNAKTGRYEAIQESTRTIESSPVCCLSDIPAPHLRYHAYRYGKFAIGFHRAAVIEAGFNPVFYTLDRARIIRSIYRGFSALNVADVSAIKDAASWIDTEIATREFDDDAFDVSAEISTIDSEADKIEDSIVRATRSVRDFLAFVKTFSSAELGTIYCEREWRSVRPFKFKFDQVAMIVVPRRIAGKNYYRNFVERFVPRSKLLRRVPVVPWDDLVEH